MRKAGAEGRPLAVRADSLVVEVERWTSRNRWGEEKAPFVVVIDATDACVELGNRRFSPARTVAMVLATPVIAWVVLFIICQYDPCIIPST